MFAFSASLERSVKAILLMLCLGSAFLFTTGHFNSKWETVKQTLCIIAWISGILSCHLFNNSFFRWNSNGAFVLSFWHTCFWRVGITWTPFVLQYTSLKWKYIKKNRWWHLWKIFCSKCMKCSFRVSSRTNCLHI